MRACLLLSLAGLALTANAPSTETLIQNGHWKRAREQAEADIRARPSDAHAAYQLARVRHTFRNLDDAVKYGELAVKLDPKFAAAHRELGAIYGDQGMKASVFKQLGFAHKCRAEFETAVALDPKDWENHSDLMEYFLEAPGFAGGDKKKGLNEANEIMKLDPARGYLTQAAMAQREKQDTKIEGLLQKAVEANPRNHGAQISLANYYLIAAHLNLAQAEQHARAALDINPDRADAYRQLAVALTLQKRNDEAAAVLARAESVIPDDLSPYVSAARALLRDSADMPKAEAYLKKYLAATKEPEHGAPIPAGVHWSLALVYEKQGRKPDAITELQTALKLKPDFEAAQKDLKRMK